MINHSITLTIPLTRNALHLKSVIHVILTFKVWNDIHVPTEYQKSSVSFYFKKLSS